MKCSDLLSALVLWTASGSGSSFFLPTRVVTPVHPIGSTTTQTIGSIATRLRVAKDKEDSHPSSDTTTSSTPSSNSTEELTAPPSAQDFLPSYKTLMVFTATTILIWISEPLLSLVDTTIVGWTNAAHTAVLQIAALGPATTLYDSSIYMTYFLAIATTNLISPALAERNWQQLRRSTSHLMGLALLFGSLVATFAFALGRPLLSQMVGPTHQALVPLATQYAWIRAAAAPFGVVDFVAQSFCLANLDTRTPAMAVLVASIVNIVGDLLLSPKWGIQGAALATALATISSSLILVRTVRKKTMEWKRRQQAELTQQQQQQQPPPPKSPPRPVNSEEESVEWVVPTPPSAIPPSNLAATVVEDIPFWSLPDKKALLDLLSLAGPIFFVMMGKIACYSIMTVRATSFGIVPLASHNIMMRVFFFFACFGDSLSQATQTFFPQVKHQKAKLLQRLFYMSAGIGVGVSQALYIILTRWGGFLTKDAAIIQTMAHHAQFVSLAILLHPFIMLLEGTILARRDLLYLVAMYVSTMTLHVSLVLSPWASTFAGLWKIFFTFQAMRLVQTAGRVFWKSRTSRLNSKASKPTTTTTTAVAYE